MGNYFKSVLESGGGGGTGIHIDSLTITHQPNLLTYVQGETIDTTGMVVTASASGMSGTVTPYCIVTPQILETSGTQEITVTYGDATATFNVTVYAIESVDIITEPTKKQYHYGETLDLTGISVRATANSGNYTKDVTNLCTYNPANGLVLTVQGTITVTATYMGVSDSCDIECYDITALNITTPPSTTAYVVGDTLSLSGMVVTATYGTWTETVSSSDYTVSPASGTVLDTAGANTITVTFSGMTATTSVTAYNWESISITSPPSKTAYLKGDTFSTSGMIVRGTAGTVTRGITSQCTISPTNGSTLSTTGEITVTATFNGFTDTTTINVYAVDRIAVTTNPSKSSYYMYDYISTSGMVVKAYGNNDTVESTITSECTTSPTNGTQITSASNVTLTVTGRSKSTTTTLTVTNTIYGAEWAGGSSSAWTRTDLASSFSAPSPAVNNGTGSSPFDNIMPWSGMTRTTDTYAGTLVSIPKFWYKWTVNGNKLKLQISNVKLNGFYTSPAHDSGKGSTSERSTVYVGAYHCSGASSGTYKSTSGVVPKVDTTRATFRTSIHNLNSKIWQWDYAMYWTIMMLYLVEYADWNTQAKIGYGCGNNTSVDNSGLTDAMTYHTGTTASSKTNYGHVRYRYIEDLWANVFDYIDGIYSSNNSVYIVKSPSSFSDSSGGTLVGTIPTTSGAIESKWSVPSVSGYEYALLPSSVNTSATTSQYTCDKLYYLGDGSFGIGNSYQQTLDKGGFSLAFMTTSTANYALGSRLMKLP